MPIFVVVRLLFQLAEYLRKKPVLVYNLINCIHSRSIAEVVQYCLLVEAPEKVIVTFV